MNTFSASSNLSSYVDAYPASRYSAAPAAPAAASSSGTHHESTERLHYWNEDSSISSGSDSSSDASAFASDDSGNFHYTIETRTPRDNTGPEKVDIQPYPRPAAFPGEDPFITHRMGTTQYGEFSEHNKRSILSMLKDKKNNARRALKAKFRRDDYYSDEESEEEWTEVDIPQHPDLADRILRKETRGREKYIAEAVAAIQREAESASTSPPEPAATIAPSLSTFDLQAAQSIQSFKSSTLVLSVPFGYCVPPDSEEFIRSIPEHLAEFVANGGMTVRLVERADRAPKSEMHIPTLVARARDGTPADGVTSYDIPVRSPLVQVQDCVEDNEDLPVGVHPDDASSTCSSLSASPTTPDLIHSHESEVSTPTTAGILSPPAMYAGVGIGHPSSSPFAKRPGFEKPNLTPPTEELLTRVNERLYSWSTASSAQSENDPPASPVIGARFAAPHAHRHEHPLYPPVQWGGNLARRVRDPREPPRNVHFNADVKVKFIEPRGTRWRSPSEESDYVEGQWRAEEGWTWVDDTAMMPRHNEYYEFLVDHERICLAFKRIIFFWMD